MKTTIFLKSFLWAFVITFLLLSCDDEVNEIVLEEIQYEMRDGEFVTIKLDPNKSHESLNFESFEEQEKYLLELEESGTELILNKEMYKELSHYFDPYEIFILDDNYSVRIGNKAYRTTRTALFERSYDQEEWQQYRYFGLSGDEDVKESELIHPTQVALKPRTPDTNLLVPEKRAK